MVIVPQDLQAFTGVVSFRERASQGEIRTPGRKRGSSWLLVKQKTALSRDRAVEEAVD